MTLYKIFKYLAIVVGIVALFFTIRIIIAGEETMKSSADLQASVMAPFMYVTYIVLAIAVILTAAFLLKDLFTGDIKETLYAIGGMIVVILIAFLVTSGEPYEMSNGQVLSGSIVHWINMGLVIFYILGIVAIGSMLYGGIRKLTK